MQTVFSFTFNMTPMRKSRKATLSNQNVNVSQLSKKMFRPGLTTLNMCSKTGANNAFPKMAK